VVFFEKKKRGTEDEDRIRAMLMLAPAIDLWLLSATCGIKVWAPYVHVSPRAILLRPLVISLTFASVRYSPSFRVIEASRLFPFHEAVQNKCEMRPYLCF